MENGIRSTGTLNIGSSSSPGAGPSIWGSSYGVYKAGGTVNWYGGSIRGNDSPGYYGTLNIPSGYKVTTTYDDYYSRYISELKKQ